MDKSCRFGSSCVVMHSDHSEEGNKTIINDLKRANKSLKATKEGIDQLNSIAPLRKYINPCNSKAFPVVKVMEKVKHTEKKKIEIPNSS